MEVLSSTQVYYDDVSIYPNPSTVQIFATESKNINLNFVTTQDLLLNIVSLAGTGCLFWGDEKEETDKYYLEGYNDRLSLTTYTKDEETRLAPLNIHSSEFPNIDKGGFVFYITYYPRGNIDQLKVERNTEFHYRTFSLPLFYYAPIKLLTDYTINFNFYNFGTKNDEIIVYDTNLFNIWATIISDKEIIKIRTDPNYTIDIDTLFIINGVFDLTFGNLFLNKSDISKIHEKMDRNDIPNVIFTIEPSDKVSLDYTSLGLEINIFSDLKTIGMSPITEGIYITGKLSQSPLNKFVYKILCKKDKPFIRIEYAANSDLIKFALSADADSEENDKYEINKDEIKCGRNLLTIKLSDEFFSNPNSEHVLFFIVFTKENNINKKLDYFTFKYLTGVSTSSFIDFLDENKRDVSLIIKDNNYKISFYPMQISGVSYFIKAVYKDELIEGEKMDTIAFSESNGTYVQINNPNFEKNKNVSFDINIDKNVSYIKIMARVILYDQKLFYLYKPVNVTGENRPNPDKKTDDTSDDISDDNNKGKSDNPNENDDSDKTILYVCIGIGSVLFIGALGLIAFIFLCYKKNKDLSDQVNKISFVQSGAEVNKQEKMDGNLLLNDDDSTVN